VRSWVEVSDRGIDSERILEIEVSVLGIGSMRILDLGPWGWDHNEEGGGI